MDSEKNWIIIFCRDLLEPALEFISYIYDFSIFLTFFLHLSSSLSLSFSSLSLSLSRSVCVSTMDLFLEVWQDTVQRMIYEWGFICGAFS